MTLDSDGKRTDIAWGHGHGSSMPIMRPGSTIDLLSICSYAIWQIEGTKIGLEHWNAWIKWIELNPEKVID